MNQFTILHEFTIYHDGYRVTGHLLRWLKPRAYEPTTLPRLLYIYMLSAIFCNVWKFKALYQLLSRQLPPFPSSFGAASLCSSFAVFSSSCNLQVDFGYLLFLFSLWPFRSPNNSYGFVLPRHDVTVDADFVRISRDCKMRLILVGMEWLRLLMCMISFVQSSFVISPCFDRFWFWFLKYETSGAFIFYSAHENCIICLICLLYLLDGRGFSSPNFWDVFISSFVLSILLVCRYMDSAGGLSLYPSHRCKTVHLVCNKIFSLSHSSWSQRFIFLGFEFLACT